MIVLMGNCLSCIKQKRQPKRSVTLAILGLDSAGKTTTTKALLGDTLDTAPTIGFNKEEITFGNYNITLYDLGGGRKIRDIWKDYLSEIYGVIYVVDSAAPERFSEVKESLKSLLSHEQVKEKPLLLLANKEDIVNHVDEVELMDRLGLEHIVNTNKCPCKMEMCSAIKGSGSKMDGKIKDGMTWLCSLLDQLYEKMKRRVDHDMEVMEQIRRKEKDERKERVRIAREERQKKEEEERKKLGEENVEEEEEGDDLIEGENPWKKLDSHEIKRKEEKFKQAKTKQKERQKRLKEIDEIQKSGNNNVNEQSNSTKNAIPHDDDDDGGLRAPRSSRSMFGLGWMNGGLTHGTEGGHSSRSPRQLLPPLEGHSSVKTAEDTSPMSNSRGKKHGKTMNNKVQSYDGTDYENERNNYGHSTSSVSRIEVDSLHDRADDDDDTDSIIQSSGRRDPFRNSRGLYIDESKATQISPDNGRKKNGRKKKQPVSSDCEEGFDTLRLSQHLENDDEHTHSSLMHDSRRSPRTESLVNGDVEDRADTPVKKLKKKKKHLRKNKLAPSDDEFELSDVQSTPNKQAIPWVQSLSPKKMVDNKDSHTNWGMAEDLPSGDEIHQFRRSRPNFDSEDDLIL